MKRQSSLRETAADVSHLAAERGGAALDQAIERLTPLVEQAASSLAEASEKLAEASEKVGPLAREYRVKGATIAARALEDAQPRINAALGKVAPAVDAAQKRVQDDLIPKLVTLLHEAADSPYLAEAAARGTNALDSVTGQLDLRPRKRKVGRTIAKVAAASALVAGVAVAVRAFLSTKDNGWAAHEPSPAYTYADEAVVIEEEAVDPVQDDELDNEESADFSSPTDSDEPVDAEVSYGEGSYVGSEPPEGYAIKGSARSKKFHTPESGSYERTTADVWFATEEAATAAGFIRALR